MTACYGLTRGQGLHCLSVTLVAGRAWDRVGSDETLIDYPSQRGLIKGAWSQVSLVKLYDASTNIASSVDELRVVRGPIAACSSLTSQSNAGVPDWATCPLVTGALPFVFLHPWSVLSVQPVDG